MWGGAPRAPPSRYRSAISTRFEITSSPLVTFNFKTFPKHRRTQFLNFLAQIWETPVWRQEVSVDFEKKNWKNDFFNFSWNKSYFFCLKLNSMWKMLSLEVLHVEIAQKLRNLEISLIFCHFLMDFQFSPSILVIFEKKFQKGAKWVGIDASL